MIVVNDNSLVGMKINNLYEPMRIIGGVVLDWNAFLEGSKTLSTFALIIWAVILISIIKDKYIKDIVFPKLYANCDSLCTFGDDYKILFKIANEVNTCL